MSDIAIKFENISKQYRLGVVGTGTISHDLNRWWHQIRGKEDPYLMVGQTNDRAAKAMSDYVWALKDINFEVRQGEVLGIIGKNGAGKSTLLKILSRVTSPTTGSIKARGRIASLLEVGTGFHPELTGRENIYMNGAIMGMTKAEITRKLDEIIDFAGVEMYIDTPSKRYSSGMTVRLGFAIAAHLEPEILVVDEVLAVGDAEFQKKAIGKMQDVSKGEGRTVLFVSHNMGAVRSLCNKGIILQNGLLTYSASANEAVDHYLELNYDNKSTKNLNERTDRDGSLDTQLIDIEILNSVGNKISEVLSGEKITIRLHFKKNRIVDYSKLFVGIGLNDNYRNRVASFLSDELGANFANFVDKNYIDLEIPALYMRAGQYHISVQVNFESTSPDYLHDFIEDVIELNVLQSDMFNSGKLSRPGYYSIFPAIFK